ncbi:MAG: Gfo/Idh/MocA family oxidoreductase, partial [bacterium]
TAAQRKLLVGCAPDTFLGAGIQTCRKIIDDGLIGEIVSAMAFMTCHGHEGWHPDPEFYYKAGGGPMLDMGPYYLTALVNLMGPMQKVTGAVSQAFTERIAGSGNKKGKKIIVETPTHITGTIKFTNGAIAAVIMSFDIWQSTVPRIEVHGTKGSLLVPDPNTFGGPVKLFKEGVDTWTEIPVNKFSYAENSRGIGLADMALAMLEHRTHRANAEMANHVLEAMLAFEASSKNGKTVELKTSCLKPDAMPAGLVYGQNW